MAPNVTSYLIRWIILTVGLCMVTANTVFFTILVQFNQAVKLPSPYLADEDVRWYNNTELLVAKNSSGVYVSETFDSRYEFDRSNGRLIIQNFTDDQNGANNYTYITKTSRRSYRLLIIVKVKIISDTQVPKELDGYGHNVTRNIILKVIPSHLKGRVAEIALYSVSKEEDIKYIICKGDRSQSDAQNSHGVTLLSKPYVRSPGKELGNHLTIEQVDVSKNDTDKKFYLHVFFTIFQDCQTEKLRPIKFHAGAEGDKHQSKTASPTSPQIVSSWKIPNTTGTKGPAKSNNEKFIGNLHLTCLIAMVILLGA